MAQSDVDLITGTARSLYEQSRTVHGGPPWEEADQADTCAALSAALGLQRLQDQMVRTKQARDGLERIREIREGRHGR